MGRLLGLGVGPAILNWITLAALRLLRAAPWSAISWPRARRATPRHHRGAPDQAQAACRWPHPVTTEKLEPPLCYETSSSAILTTPLPNIGQCT